MTREFYIADQSANSISAYKDGTGAVLRTISGSATLLNTPRGIAIDPFRREIYVGQVTAKNILVFPLDGSGNIPPSRVIRSDDITVNLPSGFTNRIIDGISYDYVKDRLHVVTLASGSGIFNSVFAIDNVSTKSGNVSVSRSFRINPSQGIFPFAIFESCFLDPINNELWVPVKSSSEVKVFDSETTVLKRTIFGSLTGFGNPNDLDEGPCQIGINLDDDEVVINLSDVGNVVTLFTFNRTDSGDIAPKRTITDILVAVDNCGIFVDPINECIFAYIAGVAREIRIYDLFATGATAPLVIVPIAGTPSIFFDVSLVDAATTITSIGKNMFKAEGYQVITGDNSFGAFNDIHAYMKVPQDNVQISTDMQVYPMKESTSATDVVYVLNNGSRILVGSADEDIAYKFILHNPQSIQR